MFLNLLIRVGVWPLSTRGQDFLSADLPDLMDSECEYTYVAFLRWRRGRLWRIIISWSILVLITIGVFYIPIHSNVLFGVKYLSEWGFCGNIRRYYNPLVSITYKL